MQSDCGGRTEDCPKCGSKVRLKEFPVHDQLHMLQLPVKKTAAPSFRHMTDEEREAAWARALPKTLGAGSAYEGDFFWFDSD